jgi:hypothetical protein
MKTLYFVSLYSHRENQWVRILLTAPSAQDAMKDAENYLEDKYWKAKGAIEVCNTSDDVYLEV